jgi:hypothetical protein
MARVEQNYKERMTAIDSDGECTGVEVPYIVFAAADEDEALAAIHETAPDEWNGVPLEAIEIESREGEDIYKVNAVYKRRAASTSSARDEDEGEATVSFDCGGGTKHLTHSIRQETVYGTKKAGGAIGWNGKSGSEMEIAGVDIPTAQLRETYTKVMRLSRITTTFKRKVASLVGKVNSASFKGWNAGEVMFLGMSFSCPARKSTKVTVAFNFAIQPNESDAKVCGKSVAKKGFEYVWALSKASAGDGVPKAEVEAIYVDQVCEYASFSSLGL